MSDKKDKKGNKARLVFEITLILLIVMMVTFYYFEKTDFFDLQQEEAVLSEGGDSNTAKYVFLNTDAKYLDMDGAYFHPEAPFTHAQMAKMIYTLLGTNKMGTDTYLDLDGDDEVYIEAVTLKTLGLFEGARFHKDEPTTFEEFNYLLKSFGYSCQSDEKDMTRRDAVIIMSGILERDVNENFEDIGTILDVPKNDEDFYLIADAALEETLPVLGCGYFYEGDYLHFIDSDGIVAVNTEKDGFQFDNEGKMTSGDTELDTLVHETLQKILTDTSSDSYHDDSGNLKFRNEDALKKAYYYVVDECSYLPGDTYEVGDTSWVKETAKDMLSTNKGNCYSFAAAFYELARALGYKAEIFSGTFSSAHNPHAWVEIEIDGENCLFDPEMEYSRTMGEGVCFYKRDESFFHKYNYKKE